MDIPLKIRVKNKKLNSFIRDITGDTLITYTDSLGDAKVFKSKDELKGLDLELFDIEATIGKDKTHD